MSDEFYISKESTMTVARDINQHIFNPQCIVNTLGETIVDLFDIDKVSVRESKVTVNKYHNKTPHPIIANNTKNAFKN
ncbi:17149_t:CDS:2 [Acaulospora morrowiae]|uniref:17149_t:CDS:1 n=1 Tax=Acaulospora morrowiae TaxID=94023 RepID=A0A9N8V3J0_9GLOM|nr:17149_t:CDS:2 [Acaulospora morrowiae]